MACACPRRGVSNRFLKGDQIIADRYLCNCFAGYYKGVRTRIYDYGESLINIIVDTGSASHEPERSNIVDSSTNISSSYNNNSSVDNKGASERARPPRDSGRGGRIALALVV